MNLELVTRETDYGIITTAEAKAYMQIPTANTTRDTSIASSILAVTTQIEAYTGYFMTEQTWKVTCINWTEPNIIRELPFGSLKYGNLLSLDSVEYYDEDEVLQTVSSADYNVNGIGTVNAYFKFKDDFDYPTLQDDLQERVFYEFTSGYAKDGSDYKKNIPELLKSACKMWVDGYENGTCGDVDARDEIDRASLRYWWGQ